MKKNIKESINFSLSAFNEGKLKRFGFGKNWKSFISILSRERIRDAENSLKLMLQCVDLKNKTFLDIGSGSGLFSLAAINLGADVYSFDYDEISVSCAEQLRLDYQIDGGRWFIDRASVLDSSYLDNIGLFDVVYSWGVLHHTGSMWEALSNAAQKIKIGGKFYIAIYNDQGWISQYWFQVKLLYNSNKVGRYAMTAIHLPYLFLGRYLARALTSRMTLERGMSLWHDMHDWLGGLPFEVAKPSELISYFQSQGLTLINYKYCGRRHGCNEFVFLQS